MLWRIVALFFAAGAARFGAAWRLHSLRRRAETRFPPAGRFVSVSAAGVRLHYVRRGAGFPVVLLHGSDGFWQDYAAILQTADSESFDFIAFDRPGHGYSDAPEAGDSSLSAQAAILHQALNSLGLTRYLLVGHSWGGALALQFALDYPQSAAGLVLVNPWASSESNPPPRLLYAARFAGRYLACAALNLTFLKRRLLHANLQAAFFPAAVPADYAERALALWQRSPRMAGAFLDENTIAWRELPALSKRCPEITAPVMIVAGESDRVVSPLHHAQRLAAQLPGAEVTLLPNAGHEIPQTHPAVVLAAIHACAARILPAAPPEVQPFYAGKDALTRVRALILRYGWNATAYQALAPDMQYWFAPDGEAAVAYAARFGVRVAAGAPICAAARTAEMVRAFEGDAARQNCGVCWFAAAARMRDALTDLPPHALLTIGAQPTWNPAHWAEILRGNKSLRAQINRAKNKGVSVREISPGEAAGRADLQDCLDDWMAHHPLPTLHFLTEPVTLDRLADRRIWIAEVNGAATAFLVATPIPARRGWMIEQIARSSNAPNGANELLVDAAMRDLAADGSDYVTLGLVPLARRADVSHSVASPAVRLLLRWGRSHGRRFYNFAGLDAFKSKFQPEEWEPLYLLCPGKAVTLRALIATLAAFSREPLPLLLARALSGSLRQEVSWFLKRLRERHASVR